VEVVGSPRPMSVLIVEDQPDVAETLRLFLELCGGYALTVAGDGEAGVRAALAHPPGAVICDIGLPKKDGFQVAEELAARLASTPLLIAVTGYGSPEVEDRARRAGFRHFLVKPADPFQLDALLREYRERLAGRVDPPASEA
jgi:CheY-like chemotaxis protein